MSSASSSISWAEEQAQIYSALQTPPTYSEDQDQLGDIIEHIAGAAMAIDYSHPHVNIALDLIKDYPFPNTIKDFLEIFRHREWNYVSESLLLARRLKLLEPNEFQRFLIGLYVWEYQPMCCCVCGLTPGIWCGKYHLCIGFID